MVRDFELCIFYTGGRRDGAGKWACHHVSKQHYFGLTCSSTHIDVNSLSYETKTQLVGDKSMLLCFSTVVSIWKNNTVFDCSTLLIFTIYRDNMSSVGSALLTIAVIVVVIAIDRQELFPLIDQGTRPE